MEQPRGFATNARGGSGDEDGLGPHSAPLSDSLVRLHSKQTFVGATQAVAIYSNITLCSYSYSASRCLIDTRPTSLSLPIGHFFDGYMNALVLVVITSARIDMLATNEPGLVLDWVTQPISYGRPASDAHEAIDERKDAIDLGPIPVDVSRGQCSVLDRYEHQSPHQLRLIETRELAAPVRVTLES
jgi:hypothetical protein